MKSIELLAHLNKKLVTLIALIVVLLCLVALEIVLAHVSLHGLMHIAQIGLFLLLLALALWIFRLKQELMQTLRSESAVLIDQVNEQASQLATMSQQMTDIVDEQSIGRDITERRNAEDALAQANNQRRLLELCVGKLHDAVVITQVNSFEVPHPRIVFVNDAYERMTGYSSAEVLGKSPMLLSGPHTEEDELQRMRSDLLDWKTVHSELTYYKKNGQASCLEMDITQVSSDMGWFRVSVMRDISERKRAQAEMLAICDRALEASRLKSEFLSSISHEMRTPMNGVIGIAQVLQDTELTSTQQLYVGHIVRAAQDYMQVIEKALDFSKANTGSLVMDRLPFKLHPMLQACEQPMAELALAKKLKFQMALDPSLPVTVLGDERRLKQCVMILLDNAVKFTAQGGVELRAHLVGAEGQAQRLRFEVCDTGIGLSESDRERMFHPFVQGDGSLTRRYGGVGLGLVLWRQLVQLMQGSMGVDSTLGQGSTFWFEIPLVAVA